MKLVLVQVHDEELVCGRQLHHHLCELLVEVGDVTARFLPQREEEKKKKRQKKKKDQRKRVRKSESWSEFVQR